MTKTRAASLCEQGILLLIVLACSLIVRDTGSRAIAEPARFSVPAANITTAANLAIAMERTALDSVTQDIDVADSAHVRKARRERVPLKVMMS